MSGSSIYMPYNPLLDPSLTQAPGAAAPQQPVNPLMLGAMPGTQQVPGQPAAPPSPNAAPQSTLDAYAQALTGTGYGQLGNGPMDPGAFLLLQQINPQLAASMIGGPQSPFNRQPSAGGGPGGDAQGAGGMGY